MNEAEVLRAAWQRLEDVRDPELPVSVVALGLVRDVSIHRGRLRVALTFTSMGCPWLEWIERDVRAALEGLDGVQDIEIEEAWERPWTREDLRDDARKVLRDIGVVP